jgi:hypothetical protein
MQTAARKLSGRTRGTADAAAWFVPRKIPSPKRKLHVRNAAWTLYITYTLLNQTSIPYQNTYLTLALP